MAECSVNDHRVVNEKQALKTVNTKALYPKAQLQKRDSGYNSPVTPGTTPENTNPSKAKSLHLGAQPLRSVSSPSALDCSEGVMQKFVQSPQLPLPQNQLASGKKIMKRQLSSPGALDSSQTKQFLHLGVQSSQLNHQQSQRMMLGQQEELQRQAPFSCDGSSVLFLAYKCKELAPLAWSGCKHPYCVMVRNNLTHMRTCYASSGECKSCQQFDSQMYRHAEECTLAGCPVDMCCNIKQQLQQEFGSLPYDHNNPFVPHPLQRGNSFSGSSSGQYYRNTNQSSLLFSFSQFESASISDDSPAARYIGARADEIVEKLDREEPLLLPEAPSTAPLTSLGRPASLLRANTVPSEDYQLNVLSPIAESPPFGVPHLLGGDYSMQSLSLMSSYEQDGIFKQGSKPAGGPKSLVVDEDDTTVFPEQQIMHKFRDDYLSIGGDGHYYQFRDYNANDNLITGGFGAVRFAEDLSSNHLFAIKCNNKDDNAIIESMETEARLLSQLGPHINVIQMYGAVLDCQEQDFLPTRMYKLMMELSQHGNLAEMVMGPETKEPFPLERDQALFYFWQVLKGVDFLHKSNVLHLDIKGSNILVFDEGRTLKICDFGTAVYVDEVASKVGKNLGTLQFSAPEICRQQMPHFSSDMWSTMCVLVEILTGKKPWEHYSSCMNGLIFTIGHYRDEQMETDLIPPGAELDPDMIELMRLVFHADGTKRASARDLLVHPLIIEAYNYEACFDEVLDDECAPVEEELSYASHSSCAPASLMLSLNPQDHTHLPEGHARFPENDLKRLSKDSGTGTDLEQEMTGQYRRMSSAGRTSDSGLDTPCTADRQILSSIGKPMFTYPEENSAEVMENDGDIHDKSILRSHLLPPPTPSEGNCKSLPNPDLQSDPITTHVQRSFSLTLPGSHSSPSPYPFSVPIGLVQRQHQCPWSYSQLRHSYSAPVIGNDHRRRLSLQSLRSYRGEEHSNGKLRRISSEIYVDRGPDIDSPDRVRNVDVSNWAQNVQKELLLAQEHDHEQECDDMASGHTPSAEDEPLTLRILQSQNRNCSPEVQGSQGGHEVDTEGFRVQVVNGSCPQEGVARAESAPEAEASKTEVEKHVTMQGRTFDVYKTVC